jgi:hypothetical protein
MSVQKTCVGVLAAFAAIKSITAIDNILVMTVLGPVPSPLPAILAAGLEVVLLSASFALFSSYLLGGRLREDLLRGLAIAVASYEVGHTVATYTFFDVRKLSATDLVLDGFVLCLIVGSALALAVGRRHGTPDAT